MKASRSLHDVAYSCFLFCGLANLIIIALPLFPVDIGVLGFGVGIPLVVAALIVMPVGILVSLVVRSWPLLALSALSILVVLEIVTEYGPAAFYNATPIVYGIAVVALCGRWFAHLRSSWPPPV